LTEEVEAVETAEEMREAGSEPAPLVEAGPRTEPSPPAAPTPPGRPVPSSLMPTPGRRAGLAPAFAP
jgi:hypothetical protein